MHTKLQVCVVLHDVVLVLTCKCFSLATEIQSLEQEHDSNYPLCISVRRAHLLADALREARKKRFDPKKSLKVMTVKI